MTNDSLNPLFDNLRPEPRNGPKRSKRTPKCLALSRVVEGTERDNFKPLELAHLETCPICGKARESSVAAKTKRGEAMEWLQGAARVVRYAARQQAAALNLFADEHREQDAFTHALVKAQEVLAEEPFKFETEAHARNWMIRTARNWVKDQARRVRTRQRYETEYTRPSAQPDLAPLIVAVREALAELPEPLRTPVELLLSGMTWQEIADECDEPLGTSYSKYKRALGKLRKLLADRGYSVEDLCDSDPPVGYENNEAEDE